MSEPEADLVDAYFDDRVDADGARMLDQRLRTDPAFRQAFAAQCRREVALRSALRVQQEAIGTTTARVVSLRRRVRRRAPKVAPYAVAAGLLAAIALAGAIVATRSQQPAVAGTWSDLPVEVAAVSDPSGQLTPGMLLRIGTDVETAGASLLHRPSGASLRLDGTSRTRVAADGFHVWRGRVAVEVPPQRAGAPFRITTAEVAVTVIGTRFSVAALDGSTTVAVQHGVVGVRSGREVRRLSAGDEATWPPTSGVASVPMPTAPAPTEHGPTIQPGVVSLAFIDAADGRVVLGGERLVDGSAIDLSRLIAGTAAIRAEVTPGVGAVRFQIVHSEDGDTGPVLEQIPPFFYPGDKDGQIMSHWRPSPGRLSIAAQAYVDLYGRQPLGRPHRVEIVLRRD